ncbi:MAG: phospholipase [Chloroflexi bacterium]|nr:phospholipase [Chloroflexota bacterium]
MTTKTINGPHQGQPLLTAGAELSEAQAAMILIHGRGASAQSIMELRHEFNQPGFAYAAPQAAFSTWYPQRFTAPIEANQPALDSALQAVADVVDSLTEQGIPADRIMILGFSQGACLAVEYAARNAQRFGGIACLSGGLIGPDGTARDYPGSLAGTPVFVGCSDVDMHIPLARVEETANVMANLGAEVDKRIYPGMGHTVNQDEIEAVKAMMSALIE